MTRSRWTPLADAALGLEKACLALRDPDSAAAVETAKAAIDEAAALVAALEPAPSPSPLSPPSTAPSARARASLPPSGRPTRSRSRTGKS
jgi:hypothetical protein